jgi:hypothetical protein
VDREPFFDADPYCENSFGGTICTLVLQPSDRRFSEMGKHTPGTSEYSDEHSSSRDSKPHVTQTSYHHDGSREKEHLYDDGSKEMAKATRELKQSQRASRERNGGSRVICTHFLETGKLDRALWAADIRYTDEHISPITIRGYHFWAIPYVRLMRRSKFAEHLMFPFAKWRAEEVAYQAGVRMVPCIPGKIIRLFGEPVCWLLGCFVAKRDWRVLQRAAAASET